MGEHWALVTGASSGIGFELARCFAADGHHLVVTADGEGELRNAANILSDDGAASVQYVARDLSHPDGALRLYQDVRGMGVKPDFLVNNAGVGVFGNFAMETDFQSEAAMIQLNIVSLVQLTKLYARDMVRRGGGRILLTSSVAAVAPTPNLAVYCGTKAFIYAFAEAIADELKDTGVTVTALMPDATETRFFERAGMEETELYQADKASPADVAKAGYRAMMRGADHVMAPFIANVHAALAALFPKRVVTASSRVE
ncbi:MAG: SDR family NAD(P)-dependent oxidoreductase [Alphaproteobacteria bacterium]